MSRQEVPRPPESSYSTHAARKTPRAKPGAGGWGGGVITHLDQDTGGTAGPRHETSVQKTQQRTVFRDM